MNGLPIEVLESTFIKGLKPEVKAELRVMRPSGLGQIMELAQLIEDRDTVVKGVKQGSGPRASGFVTAHGGKTKERMRLLRPTGWNWVHGP